MDRYWIFENEDGQFCVLAPTLIEALDILEDCTDEPVDLINDFPADEFGDNLVDAMGLDVL